MRAAYLALVSLQAHASVLIIVCSGVFTLGRMFWTDLVAFTVTFDFWLRWRGQGLTSAGLSVKSHVRFAGEITLALAFLLVDGPEGTLTTLIGSENAFIMILCLTAV